MSLINYVTKIQFGYDSLQQLASEAERAGITRPLIVTDVGVRNAGIVDKVIAALGAAHTPSIFDATPPNPNEHVVRQAVADRKSVV